MRTQMRSPEQEIVARRVAEASPHGDHWNEWPTALKIVTIAEYDMHDPMKAYDFGLLYGMALGGSGIMRQVHNKNIPTLVRVTLSNHGMLYHLVGVHFELAAAHGQSDDPERRNILVVIPPTKGYDHKERRSTFESPGIVVMIGCSHDYDLTHPFRSVTHGVCKRCSHEWEVDSGD